MQREPDFGTAALMIAVGLVLLFLTGAKWRYILPTVAGVVAMFGLAVALIGIVSNGDTFGSGSVYTRHMVEGTAAVPSVFFFLKFIATWLTAWSGVPAGIFAPAGTPAAIISRLQVSF